MSKVGWARCSATRAAKGGSTGLPSAVEQVALQLHKQVKDGNDQITMQLQIDSAGTIADVAFSGRGCAISMASASLLTDELRGKALDAVRSLGTPYVMELLGISVGPARIHCALLGLETTQKAIEEHLGR